MFFSTVRRKTATTLEAVFMITGMTIGAGVFALPYAVAQVGLPIGIATMLALGGVMLFLHLVIADIAASTNEPLQLPGLAGKYLGSWAKRLFMIVMMASLFGGMLAYMVGEGRTLAALFGGSARWWSFGFWVAGSTLIALGLQSVRTAQKIVSSLVIFLLGAVALYLFPHIELVNVAYSNWQNFWLPYGVILFALHGSPAIVEAHALLPRARGKFRSAVLWGSLIPVVLYIFFTTAVVGVFGTGVSDIATLSLGTRFGSGLRIVGDMATILALAGGFVGVGTALRQTLSWDLGWPEWVALLGAVGVPLALLLSGFTNFIAIISLVGGMGLSLQAMLMVLTYWQARREGVFKRGRFHLHHAWLFTVPIFFAFSLLTVITVAGWLAS